MRVEGRAVTGGMITSIVVGIYMYICREKTIENKMKKAIVIGASSGIGREVGRLLIDDGWHVGIVARRQERLLELQSGCPERVSVLAADVREPAVTTRLGTLIGEMGGIDLLFYAAGIGKYGICIDEEAEMSTVETNVVAFTRVIDYIYNYMSSGGKGGHIAVITSIAGTKGLGAAPAYSATKAFQSTYIEALEQQSRMTAAPVTFTDIRPGFVDTPLLAGTRRFPMLMDVEHVARLIVRAIYKRRHVSVIDWRWRLLTAAWRLLPPALWRRLRWVK